MELQKISKEHEDCTTDFNVILHKDYTVKSFIDEMTDENKNENDPNMKTWGIIYITENDNYLDSISETDYNEDGLKSVIPDSLLRRKVIDVKAAGGWFRMDYLINIDNEKDELPKSNIIPKDTDS